MPFLFGKRWQNEVGITDESVKNANMVVLYGVSFVLMFVMVLGMAFIFSGYDPEEVSWVSDLCLGTLTAVFFTMTAIGINYLYQRRSVILWLIDGFYLAPCFHSGFLRYPMMTGRRTNTSTPIIRNHT
ncbi:MAG: DUF1761 domain-containing protein [Bacteroidetes bacterium]|nr:MAG: DUF1761 domain-containing protein [Bacteroidota bacterium]